ncbi:MAG: glycerophosphoryl diester phosphodiesterase membrane domain-containing protein [Proteobacteria bacterium]|nr:glycerophosphoryl diester phosphodiesterase membrane domain-containing protein [Pseudomonadota bacterium]
MNSALYPPDRPQSVSELLDLGFRIYRASWVKSLLFAGLAALASTLVSLYRLPGPHRYGMAEAMEKLRDPVFWLLYLGCTFASVLFICALLLRQYRIATGGVPGGELRASLTPALRAIGLGLLFSVAFGMVAVAIVRANAGRGVTLGLVIAALVLLAWLAIALSCTLTEMVVAGTGIFASLRRSMDLTSGSYWRLSLVYSVALVIILVMYLVTGGVAGIVAVVLARGDVAVAVAVSSVVSLFVGAVILPFYTALGLAIYGDLTVRKEGADLARRIATPA